MSVPSNLIPTRITQLPVAPVADENSLMLIVYQGNNYQIRVGDLLAVAGVPVTRQVIAGTGMAGGGQLTNNVTLSIAPGGVGSTELANVGVTPGTYGSATTIPVFTVDAKGRVTSAGAVPVVISGYVPDSRQVIAGTGLTGGGTLGSDVTVDIDFSSVTPLVVDGSGAVGVATKAAREDHQHPAVDLSDQNQINGILPLDQGGTARSLVADAGAIIWSGADGLYVGPVGSAGQVLVSGGTGAPSWGSALVVSPQTANYVFAGPTSGPADDPVFRALVNADIPTTLDGKTLTNVDVNSGAIDGTTIGAASAAAVTGTTITASTQFSGPGTGLTGTASGLSVGSAANIAGGAANRIAYQTGAGVTAFAVAPTVASTILEWSGSAFQWAIKTSGTVTSIDASGGTTGMTFSGGPVTTTGTLTLGGTLAVANGGTGAANATSARANLSAAVTGANNDITSLVSVTGGISSPDFIQFDAALSPLPSDATGKIYYDNTDQFQTLVFQMNGSVVQHIGQEQFYRVKCSGSITKGQVVMFAGTLGSSGGLIGAAATGLAPDQSNYILGIADESGVNNDWIFVTSFGEVKNINTTGGVESWTQGQVLYYNPAVTGGLTKNKPNTPNAIALVAAVVHVGTSNGILFVRPVYGSALGGTDGNVQFGTLNNGDVIVYDGTDQRWENIAQSSLAAGSATNIAGGAANRIPYNTGAGATSFIVAPTASNTYLEWSGSAFQWSANPLGTVTSVDVSGGTTGLTFTGGPITSSGTITAGGTLAIANGGTNGTASPAAGGISYGTGTAYAFTAAGTAGQVLKSNGTSAPTWSALDGGTF